METLTLDIGKMVTVFIGWLLLPWQFALVLSLFCVRFTITIKKSAPYIQ